MADEAARAGPPSGAGFGFVIGGGEIAELFESLMTIEEGLAFADERLKFDRADFGAVLFVHRTLLPVLVLVELDSYPPPLSMASPTGTRRATTTLLRHVSKHHCNQKHAFFAIGPVHRGCNAETPPAEVAVLLCLLGHRLCACLYSIRSPTGMQNGPVAHVDQIMIKRDPKTLLCPAILAKHLKRYHFQFLAAHSAGPVQSTGSLHDLCAHPGFAAQFLHGLRPLCHCTSINASRLALVRLIQFVVYMFDIYTFSYHTPRL